jgi:hypothetical protein
MTSVSRMSLFPPLTSLVALGLLLGACKDGSGSGGDDSTPCVGPKCDDIDDPTASASAGESGPIEPTPEPRSDLGVDPPAQCDATCGRLSECLGETITDCQLECTTAREEATATSAECATAYDAVLSCIAALDCAGAADYQTAADGYPCQTEEDAAFVACSQDPQPTECDAFCALAVMCDGGEAETCAALCGESIANAEGVGADCGTAQVDAFACVGALASCDEYAAWAAAEGESYPCAATDVALVTACNQGEG